MFENTSKSSEVKKGFFNANAIIQILIKFSIERNVIIFFWKFFYFQLKLPDVRYFPWSSLHAFQEVIVIPLNI